MPYLNILIKPEQAFRQLTEDPPWKEVLLCFVLVTLVQSFFILADFITPPQRHILAHLVRLLWHATHVPLRLAMYFSFLTIPYSIGVVTVSCTAYYGVAKLLGTKASFKAFWTGYAFLGAIFALPMYGAETHRPLMVALSLWHLVLLIWMIAVVCDFSVGRAIGSFFLMGAAAFTAFAVIGIGVVLATAGNSHFLQRFLKQPPLVRVDLPADYQWTAQTLDGRPITAKDLRGKVVVLNFWATWCAPCKAEIPSLERLYEKFKSEPRVAILCLSDEDIPVIQNYVQKAKWSLPIARLIGERPAPYASVGIPATFILSPAGRIVVKHEGAALWDTENIVQLVQKLLTNGAPSPS